jgi:hypothetical protein
VIAPWQKKRKRSKRTGGWKEEKMKAKKLIVMLLALGFFATCAAPVSAASLKILNPVGEPKTDLTQPAKRLDTLEGKRIGLYVARRANAFEVMERVAENLQKQYKNIVLMGGKEGTLWAKKAYDRPGDIDLLMKQKPDAIIMAMSS